MAEGDYPESPAFRGFVFTKTAPSFIVHRCSEGQKAGGKKGQAGETPTCYPEFTQREPGVHHCTTFTTADKLFAQHPI